MVTGVQTCALPISPRPAAPPPRAFLFLFCPVAFLTLSPVLAGEPLPCACREPSSSSPPPSPSSSSERLFDSTAGRWDWGVLKGSEIERGSSYHGPGQNRRALLPLSLVFATKGRRTDSGTRFDHPGLFLFLLLRNSSSHRSLSLPRLSREHAGGRTEGAAGTAAEQGDIARHLKEIGRAHV